MISTEIVRTDGFATHVLRSRGVEVRVVPSLGAKITGLRNLRSGREWLWSAPDGRGLRASLPGDAFESGSMAGIDECLPTVAPCALDDIDLPDHGEAWSRSWTVDAAAWAQGRLLTTLNLSSLPLRIERELTLDQDVVTLRYRLINLSPAPQVYLWALHPLLAWREGDRIELSPEIATANLALQLGLLQANESAIAWPCPEPGLNLSTLNGPPSTPWYAKLFTAAPHDGRASIVNDLTGDRLSILFEPCLTPHLGIWITRGGWNGFEHIALEPTNHPTETPVRTGLTSPPVIPPHVSKTWAVRLSLGRNDAVER